MAYTITQLRSFLAVVRGGSITSAADALVVTQPSVSAALAALNREVGIELFERHGRGVRLSAAGEAFAPYAADVIGLLETGRTAAHEAAAGAVRTLRLTAVTTAAESFVLPLMQAFASEHPELELILDVGNRGAVLDAVLSHRADVAIAGQPPENERVAAVPLMDNEIILVVAAGDPLAGGAPVEPHALRGRTWLLREEASGTRALNERFLDTAGLHPQTLTLGSNGAIKQAVRAGLGVSLISRAAVEMELASGLLAAIALTDPPAARRWWALRSAVGPVRQPVADFMAFAVTVGAAGSG
ncbi:MAG: LysR family transcriptional regulator [Actinomycetota bacterium]|nr:LysR family transcriptional regulator [Actinomycetota bacterium]